MSIISALYHWWMFFSTFLIVSAEGGGNKGGKSGDQVVPIFPRICLQCFGFPSLNLLILLFQKFLYLLQSECQQEWIDMHLGTLKESYFSEENYKIVAEWRGPNRTARDPPVLDFSSLLSPRWQDFWNEGSDTCVVSYFMKGCDPLLRDSEQSQCQRERTRRIYILALPSPSQPLLWVFHCLTSAGS